MKRKGFFILLIVGVLLLIFGVMKFISSRTPKEGQLRVESVPTVSIFWITNIWAELHLKKRLRLVNTHFVWFLKQRRARPLPGKER